jgi:putative ABC transport system permease protein
MWILRTLKLGVKSLLLHPMRSFLTVIGIFIGVASVIWLLAIGEGVSREAKKQIESLGAENIIVRTVEPPEQGGGNFREVNQYGLTRAEHRLLDTTIPTVEQALPIRELPKQFAYTGNPNVKPIDGRLVGCTPEYQEVTRLVVDRGHFLTAREIETKASVCVIAGRLAEKLFPSEDPINKQIFLPENKERYKIVGVLKHRQATAAIGGSLSAQDFAKDVYIPITTMRQRMGDVIQKRSSGSFSVKHFELTQVTIRVKSVDDVPRTAKLVENTLKRNDPNRQDIAVIVPYELLEQAEATRIMLMAGMVLIAGISLIVGGIGIMNIMLATVTERTREIGIRRALGANRGDIIRQFLVETVVLSVGGGIAGVIVGLSGPKMVIFGRWVLAKLSPKSFEALPEAFKAMEPVIVWQSLPIAFLIAVIIGIVFGIYPAMRAAQMDPIEALRHE